MSDPVDNASPAHRPASIKDRALILGVGLLGNQAFVWSFDFVLYPYVMWRFGLLQGWLIMTALSAATSWLTLLFYDWSKKDWLGIEAIKELKEAPGQGRLSRFLGRLMQRGDGLAMLVLSVQFDPFITMAYLRPGSYRFNGLTPREWRLFWFSVLVGNLYWSVVAFTGVAVFRWVWQHIWP